MNVRSPFHPANAGQISADGRSALVEFQIRGDADLAVEKIDPILLGIADAQAAHPQFFIGTFGDASVDQELEGAFMDDLKKAGLYSVPIPLIILIVVFGALVAAGIPAARADGRPGDVRPVGDPEPDLAGEQSLYAMILLIGLAVGVDYSMFYLKREREERAAGRSSKRRSRSPLRRRDVPCSSPARRSSSPWRACSSPGTDSRPSESPP